MAVKQVANNSSNCPGFSICPPSDGSVASCKQNCQCVYCGNQSQVTACVSQCMQSNGAISIGVNPQPVQDAINSVLTPIEQALPAILEKMALFIFALILIIAGFMVVKS